MQIVVNLVTKRVQMTVADSRERTQYDFKRGDGAEVEIIYVRDNIQEQLPLGSSIVFCCKEADKFDGPAIVFEDNFPLSGTGITAKYTGNPSFNTIPLDALLIVDGDSANDKSSVDLIGEVTWNDGIGGPHTSTITFKVRVDNDVYRGGENTPAGLPDLTLYIPTPLQLTAPPVNGGHNLMITMLINGSQVQMFMTSNGLSGANAAWTGVDDENDYVVWEAAGMQWEINHSVSGSTFRSPTIEFPDFPTGPWTEIMTTGAELTFIDFTGTPGTLGQPAIISTSNLSGSFKDVWTCIQESPVAWKPPGEITRAPNGTLYRSIVANDGTPSTELAYP